jgi:Family of unknown function (DUF5689)
MKNIKLIVSASLFLALQSCVNSDNYDAIIQDNNCATLVATKTVNDVAALATTTAQTYTAEDIIEAYVTSSDEGGNFYKSISMVSVDGTKGFTVPVDAFSLYTKYEPGRKVYVNMKDLTFANDTQIASLEIGSLFEGQVGRLSGVNYEQVLRKGCEKVDPASITNQLTVTQAKNNANINKLIELNNVQFTDASLGKKYFDATLNNLGGATNHEITDASGNKIIVRVSEFANFASNNVPSLSGKITGVLTKFGSDFQLMVRTTQDIQLTNTRLEVDFAPPIVGNALTYDATLNEPFTNYNVTNQQVFPKYVNDAVTGTRYWQVKTFGGNKYIQMSSFGGTAEANRTLFFVPVDFTAASNFNFKTKAGFANGTCLKVYYTTNYTPGVNVNTATLTEITSSFTISAGLTSGYPTNFTNSGNYAIPGTLTGNGFFVFEYIGNGNGGVTTTMQIDDIVIN